MGCSQPLLHHIQQPLADPLQLRPDSAGERPVALFVLLAAKR